MLQIWYMKAWIKLFNGYGIVIITTLFFFFLKQAWKLKRREGNNASTLNFIFSITQYLVLNMHIHLTKQPILMNSCQPIQSFGVKIVAFQFHRSDIFISNTVHTYLRSIPHHVVLWFDVRKGGSILHIEGLYWVLIMC